MLGERLDHAIKQANSSRETIAIIAEGVVSQPQAGFLSQHGCHEIQGLLNFRPMPATELADALGVGRHIAR